MAYKIIYKKRFSNKLIRLLLYLENEWGQKAAINFLNELDKRINTIKEQPFIGKPSRTKPEVRSVLIAKHNRVYYKTGDTVIVILNMYDMRSNPKKNPYGY